MCFSSRRALQNLGFKGFIPLGGVCSRLTAIPNVAGVYAVVASPQFRLGFLELNPAGRYRGLDPTIHAEELQARWVEGAYVLYFGKADGRSDRSTLRARVKAHIRQGKGYHAGHWGGRRIWQLTNAWTLEIAWLETKPNKAYAAEQAMIAIFKLVHGRHPFGNR